MEEIIVYIMGGMILAPLFGCMIILILRLFWIDDDKYPYFPHTLPDKKDTDQDAKE